MDSDRLSFGDSFFSFIYEFDKLERLISKKTNLYSGQPRILTILMTEDGITLKELANRTHLGMPSLSVSIKNMEKSGLVYKIPDPDDSRTSHIYLTEKGQSYGEAFHHLIHAYFLKLEEAFQSNSPDNLEDIIKQFLDTTTSYYNQIQ